MSHELTATDLFAGGGGATEGLTQAGFRVLVAANHWDLALATHSLNHPDIEHRSDNLSEVNWRTFPTTDLLWASPSCVWHSPAGGRKKLPAEVELRREDAGAIDRATAFAVIAAAEVHRYPVIIVENVPYFAGWVLYQWWLNGLRALGYTLQIRTLDAKNFGHAQNRPRLFVVATRGVHIDLTPPSIAPVYAASILDPDPGTPLKRRLYVTPQIDSIPEENVPYLVTYRNHAKARRWDRHGLAAVTAGGNHHAVAQIIDGVPHHRMLTNRECARAQGFPDRYQFVSNRPDPGPLDEDQKRLIGNAVPVGVAKWLGERAAAALTGSTPAFADDLLDVLALTGTEG